MAKTNDPVASVKAAIEAIDNTQQSMDTGKVPVAFNRSNLPSRLMTIFQRSQAIYLDRYLRTWKAFTSGRITKGEFIRTMVTYHVWVPLFESLVTAGGIEKDELALAMVAGPLSYHLIIGLLVRTLIAGAIDLMDEEALPAYMRELGAPTLLDSMRRDITNVGRAVYKILESPDYETMWGGWKAAADAAEMVTAVPTGWLARTPEAFYTMAQGDPESMMRGFKKLAGWSDARTKE
jgi:hypothetical protein